MDNNDRGREKQLGIIVCVLIVGSMIFCGIIDPGLERHKELKIRLGELELRYAKIKGDVRVKDRIESAYSKIESLIESGAGQQQVSDFTRQLSKSYSNLGLKIRSVKILPSLKEKFYRRLFIKIEMTGKVREFLRFTANIEAEQSPLRIERFDIKAGDTVDLIVVSVVVSKVVSVPGDIREDD